MSKRVVEASNIPDGVVKKGWETLALKKNPGVRLLNVFRFGKLQLNISVKTPMTIFHVDNGDKR